MHHGLIGNEYEDEHQSHHSRQRNGHENSPKKATTIGTKSRMI